MTTPLPATMRAARFDASSGKLTVEDVPVPVPGPNEVLVKVEACGICLSDVHLIEGTLPGPLPVVTPGHEAAGTIAVLGETVQGWQVGDRVVMAGGRQCSNCAMCHRGRFEECEAFEIMGFNYDGAWAQYVVTSFGGMSSVPDDLPLERACVLADAVATPYAALTDRAQLQPGESIALWGIGGLGVHAVQTARMVGASPIIAIDPSEAARERALRLGADHALDPAAVDVVAEVRRLTGGRGVDVAVDLVGANAVLQQGADCLARFGRVVMVGLSLDPIELGIGVFFGIQSQSLLGHLGYKRKHLDDLVGLVSTGRLDITGSVSGLLPLEDVADGVEQLTSKRGNPIRLVVQPWT